MWYLIILSAERLREKITLNIKIHGRQRLPLVMEFPTQKSWDKNITAQESKPLILKFLLIISFAGVNSKTLMVRFHGKKT